LHKELNTLDVTAITAGIVIGAGLFVVTGIGAKSEDTTGYDSLFWASFGISFRIQIQSGGGRKTILFDTASDPDPVLHNMKLLQLSPESIDAIILSHRHFDHTGDST